MDHETIKASLLEQAKSRGIKSSEVKVLSTDPFFVGTDKDYVDARWASGLWDRMMARRKKQLHLRGFHYWIQSQGIPKPDGNKYAHGPDPAKDWFYLLHAAQMARYLGVGGWKNLVDLKHPNPIDYDNYYVGSGIEKDGRVDPQTELEAKLDGMVDEFLRSLLNEAPKYRTNGYQVYHLEVLCEKGSMGFVIEPACKRYEATYQPFVGQASVEKIDMMAERAVRASGVGKKVRIFYIADYDRYGRSMIPAVARKIEFMTWGQKADIKLLRLALSEEQIKKFNLPYAPKHGEEVVELDALEAIHPGELGKIVELALSPYYDGDKPKVVDQENRRIRESIKDLLDTKVRPALEQAFEGIDLGGIASEIDLKSTIDPTFRSPEPEHDVDDRSDDWVYDSGRPYWEQWQAYKTYKRAGDPEDD